MVLHILVPMPRPDESRLHSVNRSAYHITVNNLCGIKFALKPMSSYNFGVIMAPDEVYYT